MSYTHANVSWEACASLDDDGNILNRYGDIEYEEPVDIIARKQPHNEVINGEGGKIYLSKSIYYVDPNVESNASEIRKYDKLDGEMIINIYEMRDLYNRIKMIRFITV